MTFSASSLARSVWRLAPKNLRHLAHRCLQAHQVIRGARVGRHSVSEFGKGTRAILGVLSSSVGLGRGARLFVEAMQISALRIGEFDCSAQLGHQICVQRKGDIYLGQTRRIVAHLNPIDYLRALGRSKQNLPSQCTVAGYWAWETSCAPKSWQKGISVVDEIWCPSSFVAEAVRERVGDSKPIRVVPHPVGAMLQALPNRAIFGLPTSAFIFFLTFDHRSVSIRKNPILAIEAFERSQVSRLGAVLLIKEGGVGADEETSRMLHLKAAATPGVKIISKDLSAADMSVLRASIDAVLSMHRSEGFGLSLAEAMMVGKPVLATGWSGNMDFMCERSAGLIDYKLVPARDPSGIYNDGLWALPDAEHAAQLMRKCIEDDQWRISIASHGAKIARKKLSVEHWLSSLPDWFIEDTQSTAAANACLSSEPGAAGGSKMEPVWGVLAEKSAHETDKRVHKLV